MTTTPHEDGNEFRKPIDLGPVRGHRLNAVRHGLGPFITPEASDATLLALWKFALEPPQRYFDQKAAITVRDTLQGYAKKDGARLAEILEELKPRLDVAFYHLGAVNDEVDDGRWPEGGDPAMARAVDERFIYRHLSLMEYVVDFLSLPIIAFHCEKQRRKAKTLTEVVGFRTGTRLKDHLPKTPIGFLAKFWRPVVRNASAHGGVSHTLGGLRFVDDSGNSEEHLYRGFIRLTDRLLDACNGAALGYMAFLLQHPPPPSGSWPVPMGIAREALRGLLDQPDFRLVHLTSLTRGDNTRLLNLHFEHRLVSEWAIRIKAYRAAFAAMDVLPEFDVFGVGLHSPEMILSFTMVDREDMMGYDDGRIDLAEFCRRCAANGELVWESRIRFPWLKHKWQLYSGIAMSFWTEYKSRRTSEEWSEDRARFELIDVVDCSSDDVKARRAAVALDALPGKAKQLEFPDLAEKLVKAVDRASMRLTARDPKAAHRRGRCDRVWVRVFTRRVRPRDSDGGGFADPYLLTVEYSESGEFQKVGLIDHEVHEFEKYRVSMKKLNS